MTAQPWRGSVRKVDTPPAVAAMGPLVWEREESPGSSRYVMDFPSELRRLGVAVSPTRSSESPLYCVRHYFGNDHGLICPWMILGSTTSWISFSLPPSFLHCPSDMIDMCAAGEGRDVLSLVHGELSIVPSVVEAWFELHRPGPNFGTRDREADIWWLDQEEGTLQWRVAVERVSSWEALRLALLGRVSGDVFPPHLVHGWVGGTLTQLWLDPDPDE